MARTYRNYSDKDLQKITELYKQGMGYYDIGQRFKPPINGESIRWQVRQMIRKGAFGVDSSPFPLYDKPLEMEGDALVLPDVEAPYHHADFLNNCIQLAMDWRIHQCILAGDLLHFDSLSAWGAEFVEEPEANGYHATVKILEDLYSNATNKREKTRIMRKIDEVERSSLDAGPSYSTEMALSRKVVQDLDDAFDEIHFLIGNHEARFIRAIQSHASPQELLINLQADPEKWKVAPYYYSYLYSGGKEFQIEHPVNAAKNSHIALADKYHKNVLMAHSHMWKIDRDKSGKYWAIQMGCVVDERRLPYASQRHNTRDAHRLGAVIVRNGYPWVLGEESDWEALARLGG